MEDRLNQLFDPLKASLNISTASEVRNLIQSLADHERIVVDMIDLRFSDLVKLASSTNSDLRAIDDALNSTIEECRKKRQTVIDIGRSIIDKM